LTNLDRNHRHVRVVVADDHLFTRAGLRAVLSQDPEFELVGEATSGAEAVALARSLQPELVLMDLRMPDMDGLAATRAIKQVSPATTVLILSMFEDSEMLVAAVRAGAAGYVLKDSSETALRTAMSDALAGNFPLARHLVDEVIQRMPVDAIEPTAVASADSLSARERQVLELLARGHTNKAIAEALVITPSTVKVHVEHILSKLGVGDRTEAAVRALELGYITPDRSGQGPRPASQTRAESHVAC
jgi:DNA-binding NarL/FixJ family response regulator